MAVNSFIPSMVVLRSKVSSLGKTKTRIWLGVSASDKEFVAAVFKTDGSTKDLYVSNDRGN
ncbi:hypothetical protein MYP_709 [Sporocytophaga myxococcoides]|uniref:Uncharacterized protein n=1 Tax=Sporocytophaga myxococcoides TaxID=153721 RepID=A0A098LAL6_9BACT|nr:hypothetical protein MYP_709 [Sporocytophaga myxococcoides]